MLYSIFAICIHRFPMNFKIERQLTVALENYPGRLAAVSSTIAEKGINIEALSLIDSIEQGLIRLITSEPSTCKKYAYSTRFLRN